jgi:PAS domain S-box-containing protein
MHPTLVHESEERFKLMTDSAPVMMWVSGPDKLCTYFNKGWLQFTGRTLDQELGNGWAQGVHAEDLDRCLATYHRAFERRQPFRIEYRLRRFDGAYRWIVDIGAPRFESDGNFVGYIGSCIDMTDRKQVELSFNGRIRFEMLLSDLSVAFINLPPDEVERTIETCLQRLVQFSVSSAVRFWNLIRMGRRCIDGLATPCPG